MLEGVTPFPPEELAALVEKGYWEERPLIDGFREVFERYAGRTALIGDGDQVTYRQLDERSSLLARHLLDLGFAPLDRVVVQLPNTVFFAYFYFALQKIGGIPILALPAHRRREVSQFVEIAEGKRAPCRRRLATSSSVRWWPT